jgi:hypothetical protein
MVEHLIARLMELEDEHVQWTKTLCDTHFPLLVAACDSKFSSKVVKDVLQFLASDSDFVYMFRGTLQPLTAMTAVNLQQQ